MFNFITYEGEIYLKVFEWRDFVLNGKCYKSDLYFDIKQPIDFTNKGEIKLHLYGKVYDIVTRGDKKLYCPIDLASLSEHHRKYIIKTFKEGYPEEFI